MAEAHGGNLEASAQSLGVRPSELLDASASLAPFTLPRRAVFAGMTAPLRAYPERRAGALCSCLAGVQGLDPDAVLPGNGAAALFTGVARDQAAVGVPLVPQPGCWA